MNILSPFVYLGIQIQDSWQSPKPSMTADWCSCPPQSVSTPTIRQCLWQTTLFTYAWHQT